jgi:hypothetical protein
MSKPDQEPEFVIHELNKRIAVYMVTVFNVIGVNRWRKWCLLLPDKGECLKSNGQHSLPKVDRQGAIGLAVKDAESKLRFFFRERKDIAAGEDDLNWPYDDLKFLPATKELTNYLEYRIVWQPRDGTAGFELQKLTEFNDDLTNTGQECKALSECLKNARDLRDRRT